MILKHGKLLSIKLTKCKLFIFKLETLSADIPHLLVVN